MLLSHLRQDTLSSGHPSSRTWASPDAVAPQSLFGAVTFIQRGDFSLRMNVHFRCLVLDGVYVRDDAPTHEGIEGVTLIGGEPFEQAEAFADFAWTVRAAGLSVMAFTGYELVELVSPGQRRLLEACDIIVAGRYVSSARAGAGR